MIRATYRLQFRQGVTFTDAARLAPHLRAAGISQLYASPVFAATEGSSHGYDVTDHNAFDESLGGAASFEAMVAALKVVGIGLILDIVPNHMAASPQNPWWRDVLKHGQASRYAKHFDIDWASGKLILPILGQPYGETLQAGDLTRAVHPEWGPVLRVPGNDLPLAPGSETIEDVHACHEAQHYRLTFWRLGMDGLNYRRFFEITGLAGVRVEDPKVFEDVHGLVLRLCAEGKVDALRVDHVDGLADPTGYLERLAQRAGVPILVEKILEPSEVLREWPVIGTTGYEFAAALGALFTDEKGLAALTGYYGPPMDADLNRAVLAAKWAILTRNLASELAPLVALARTLFADDLSARDYGEATVREALVALMCAFPVYRTYIVDAPDAADRAVIGEARDVAVDRAGWLARPIDALVGLLCGQAPDPNRKEFVRRFQQLTGPLMAKAVEDTMFYRHHRLIGLNEVGGAMVPTLGPAAFFEVGARGGLAATQTHDTKRGEDARARLYALSELRATTLFATTLARLPQAPNANLRWALAQMLFAAEPLADDPDFSARFREAALKTVREAKQETSWTETDEAFEAAVAQTAEAMVAARTELGRLRAVQRAGGVIGLAQALLKTMVRPAPDLYQGTFDWDFSMVDPDNRRPVDFAAETALCRAALEADPIELLGAWQDGRVKARVLLEGLAARRERPLLFAEGTIEPLRIDGPLGERALAFLRTDQTDTALVVVPVRAHEAVAADSLALEEVAEGSLSLPGPLTRRIVEERLPAGEIALGPLLRRFPVLLATSWTA